MFGKRKKEFQEIARDVDDIKKKRELREKMRRIADDIVNKGQHNPYDKENDNG